jgi:thiol-disulfide isomerase/thioredoxin
MKTLLFLGLFLSSLAVIGQDLVGPIHRTELNEAPHDEWFASEYKNYSPLDTTINKLKPLMKDVSITVFMGTWCSDSQLQVPAFFRILDELGYTKKVSLIAVDEDKKTPTGSAAKNNITNVPTFIFYKNGKELNRIVEFPLTFLEDDMLQIMNGEQYKHAYEE